MKTYYGGRIEGCSSTGSVTASGGGNWSWAGGIAGTISGDGDGSLETGPTRIARCYATGAVTAEGPSGSWPYAGGIVGYNYYGGLVSRCYYTGGVTAAGEDVYDYTGGIAGYNSKEAGHSSVIEDCWSSGSVSGRVNVGGIVGQNQIHAVVRRCYSRSALAVRAAENAGTSQSQRGAGGVAGYNAGTVTACAALNPSISSGGFGLIRRVAGNGSGALENNRASSAMGITISGGAPPEPESGENTKDGADCEAQPEESLFGGALGWDFAAVWEMGDNSYPVLQWQQ
jgi:hypothetical protein